MEDQSLQTQDAFEGKFQESGEYVIQTTQTVTRTYVVSAFTEDEARSIVLSGAAAEDEGEYFESEEYIIEESIVRP